MKKTFIWILVATLVLISVPIGIWRASAGAPPVYAIKILEISDTGTYTLRSAISQLSGASNVTVDTMRMKTFVALREQLAGKYDAIYFGQGTYSPEKPKILTPYDSDSSNRVEAHDTASVMNDITDLKIKEVQEGYINAGLPVLFFSSTNSGTTNFDRSSKLYSFYIKNRAKNNVVTISSDTDKVTTDRWGRITSRTPSDLKTKMTTLMSGNLLKQRPMIVMKTSPSTTQTYKAGQKIDFAFDLYRADGNSTTNATGDVNVKLYVNVDEVFVNTDDNIVANAKLTNGGGTLSYTVPKTYSGPLYWHLEANFSGTASSIEPKSPGLLTYSEGKFTLLNEVTNIRVLQVMNNNGDGNLTNNPARMNSEYLKNSALGYNITIKAIQFGEFVKPEVYQHLNGNYDMIIFGFADEFGRYTNSQLSADVTKSVNDFIKTGQAVMYTHDTILTNSDNTESDWAKNFGDVTGQSYLKTNMGYANPVGSNEVKEINSGLLTQFPFDLRTIEGAMKSNDTSLTEYHGSVAWTHNQYYMINLNDRNIIPWYTMVGGKRDTDDSWDHYYTYSNKNVTYSGTGHSSWEFPIWEQKLFVNTMYRAFIGSNHAPEIEVIAPGENELNKPSYLKDFLLSYQVDDLDLADVNLYSSVKVKVNGQYVDSLAVAEAPTVKGQVITRKINNILPLSGGTIEFEITARDKQGAVATKTVSLKVEEMKVNLVPERDVYPASSNYRYAVGKEVEMRYTVTPQKIEAKKAAPDEQLRDTLEISEISYNEKLPKGLIVSGKSPSDIVVTAPTASDAGSILSYKIPRVITYKLNGDYYEPVDPTPISFKIFFNTNAVGRYPLPEATLIYKDVPTAAQSVPDKTVPSSGSTEALNAFKNYNLLLLGNEPTTLTSNQITGRVASMGDLTLNNPTFGKGLTNDTTIPVVYANSNLSIVSSNGSITNGPIIVNGQLNIDSFGFENLVMMAKGDITLKGNSGIKNSSVWTNGNFFIPNNGMWISQGVNFYAAGNVTMAGGSNGGKITYGGTYNNSLTTSTNIIRSTSGAVKNSFNEQLASSNAKGIQDFAAVASDLKTLSANYAAMTENGQQDRTSQSELVLNGKQTLNVFNLEPSDLNNASLTDIRINKTKDATTIINLPGTDSQLVKTIKIYNDNQLIANATGDPKVLFNFAGTGTLTLRNAIPGSVLAPNAKISFGDGNIYGSLAARTFTNALGGYSLNVNGFNGASPQTSMPSVPDNNGKIITIDFPYREIKAVPKLTNIQIDPVTLWVGETFNLLPETEKVTAYSQPGVAVVKETWTSNSPNIVTVSDKGIINAVLNGQATVTLEAEDELGTKVSKDVIVTVEPAPLSIAGSDTVNLADSISDLRAVYDRDQMSISDMRWSLVGIGDTDRAQLGTSVTGETVSLTGRNIGEVTLQLQATLTKKSGTRASRTFTAQHIVKVINPLTSVTLNAPDWISVNKPGYTSSHAAELTATTNPTEVRVQSVDWTITNGNTSGTLARTTTGTSKENVLNASTAPGQVTVRVTVTPAGTNTASLVKSGEKTIRVVDVDVNGPESVYIDNQVPVTFSAVFNTADVDGWTKEQGRPSNYFWKVENLKLGSDGNWSIDTTSGIPPYAQLSSTNGAATSLSPSGSGLEGKVRVTVTVGGMTSYKDVVVKARLTGLQLPPEIPIRVGQNINLNLLLNPVPGVMVNKLSEILPALKWESSTKDSATVTTNAVPPSKDITGGIVTGRTAGTSTIVTVTYPEKDGAPAVTTTTRIVVISGNTPGGPDNPVGPENPTNPGEPTGNNLY